MKPGGGGGCPRLSLLAFVSNALLSLVKEQDTLEFPFSRRSMA